jgi:hypothetical protein
MSLLLSGIAWGQGVATRPATAPAVANASLAPALIVVIGAAGDPEFLDVFTQSAERWADAGAKAHAQTVVIGRKPAEAGASANPTEKEQLRAALEAQSRTGRSPLWLVFIGHGTFDGREAKINLRGPDVSQNELFDWLKPFSRPVAVIDCTSASAPFLTKLSVKGANRVIVTATRSGSEINYARFGMFLSQSIADPAADLDKDGQTSLLEAFLAASHRTAEFYKTESRLATEHALLDDNGDALGTPADFFDGIRATKAARNGASVDGPRAHQWVLVQTAEELALSPEQRDERAALERQIEALRAQKASMPENAYYTRLDGLMLRLARVYAGEVPKAAPPATMPTMAP